MKYEEFKTELITTLSTYFDHSYEISIQNITKNNETKEDALIIVEEGRNISPTIYLKPYYKLAIDEKESILDIADSIRCVYYDSKPSDDFNIESLLDYDGIKPYITYKLINYEKNTKRLKNLPNRKFLDLAIIYEIQLTSAMLPLRNLETIDDNTATITITNDLLSKWNISEDELYNIAKHNADRLNPPVVKSLMAFCESLLNNIDCEQCFEEDELPVEMDAYILTNNTGRNGATVMLYKNQLAILSNIMNDDLVIIPSSIHEVIVFRKGTKNNIDEWNSIIDTVNSTELDECDILSDHAYFYLKSDKMIHYKEAKLIS